MKTMQNSILWNATRLVSVISHIARVHAARHQTMMIRYVQDRKMIPLNTLLPISNISDFMEGYNSEIKNAMEVPKVSNRGLKKTALYATGVAWIGSYVYQSISLSNLASVTMFFSYEMPFIKDFWGDHIDSILRAADNQMSAVPQIIAEQSTIIAGLVAIGTLGGAVVYYGLKHLVSGYVNNLADKKVAEKSENRFTVDGNAPKKEQEAPTISLNNKE